MLTFVAEAQRRRECDRLWRLPEWGVSVQLGLRFSGDVHVPWRQHRAGRDQRCTHRVRGRSGRRRLRLDSRSSAPRFHPMACSSSGSTPAATGQYGGDFYWDGGSSQITPGETSLWVGPLAIKLLRFPARVRQTSVFRARRARATSQSARSCSGCTRRSAHRCQRLGPLAGQRLGPRHLAARLLG